MRMKLVVLGLCLISFVGGMTLHFLYPKLEPPLKTKAMKRWELRRTLQLVRAKLSDATLIEEKDMGAYVQRLLRFRWQELSHEAYLLIPKQQGKKTAAILALHGHQTTKEEVVGIKRSRFGVDFGLRFVKSGFCVLAPDIPYSDDIKIEDHVALNLIMAGTTSLTGMRVSYLEALLEYLCSLPAVDQKRVGCVGWSMGGALAMYLSAVNKKVKVVGISDYFGTYEDIFIKKRHSTDNYIPGIWSFGEMADVACMIAPRPLLLEGGDKDPAFPKEAFMKGIDDLKNCYEGHEECLTWQVISGGHRFEGKGFEEWFKRWL